MALRLYVQEIMLQRAPAYKLDAKLNGHFSTEASIKSVYFHLFFFLSFFFLFFFFFLGGAYAAVISKTVVHSLLSQNIQCTYKVWGCQSSYARSAIGKKKAIDLIDL